MAKRKDSPQTSGTPEETTDKSEKAETGIAQPPAPLASIESPNLVPPAEQPGDRSAAVVAASPQDEPTPELPRATPTPVDVVTVSFAQAAAEAAALRGPAERRQAALAAYLRTRRVMALAASVAVAAAVGAMTGSLATAGLTRLLGSDQAGQSSAVEDSRLLKQTIVQLGTEIGALRANIDSSAKSTGAQFSRLGERLDRADRAQAEAAGKLAKMSETLERRSVAATPPAAAPAADSVITGSIPATPPPQLHAPATRPAGQPIVEGWTLRNVYNGSAVIQGRIGLVEVEPGDTIPGLGRIETIRRQDGRWVVVTNRGLIIAR